MKDFLIWKAFAIYNHWCRWRLFAALPGIRQEIAEYAKASQTTGTKFPTLWRAVRLILRHRPALILEAGTGQVPAPYWRPPYGVFTDAVLATAAAAGYTKTIMWSLDTIDWRPLSEGGPTAEQIASNVVTSSGSGSIILMHLGGYETLDALRIMVPALRERGLLLTSVSDLVVDEPQPSGAPVSAGALVEEDLMPLADPGQGKAYWQQVSLLVSRSWARQVRGVRKGPSSETVRVRFKLYPSGRAQLIEIEKGSGVREIDEAAFLALIMRKETSP